MFKTTSFVPTGYLPATEHVISVSLTDTTTQLVDVTPSWVDLRVIEMSSAVVPKSETSSYSGIQNLCTSYYQFYQVRLDYNQYLNCRGDASPHRELASPHRHLASPHRDLDVHPRAREHEWIVQIPAEYSPKLRWRPFFWSSFNCGDGTT